MNHLRRMAMIFALCLSACAPAMAKATIMPLTAEAMEACYIIGGGNAAKGIELAREKLAARSEPPILSDHATAELLSCLGTGLNMYGDYDQAEAAYREALTILEDIAGSVLGAELTIYVTRDGLANTYEFSGRRELAVELRRELVEQTNNPSRKITQLGRIGDLHLLLGQRRASEAAYQRALTEMTSIGEKQRASELPTYRRLATLYWLEERYEEAEASLDTALAFAERVLGTDSIYTILLAEAQGWTYFYEGRHLEARTMAGRALAYHERTGELPAFMVTDANILLARVELAERPGSSKAEQLLTSSLSVEEEAPIQDLLSQVDALWRALAERELARFYLLKGKFTDSEVLARPSAELLEIGFGEAHFETARAKLVLAQALKGQHRERDALPAALSAYATQQRILPPYSLELGETLEFLVELHDALGRSEDLEATLKLLAAYRAERAKLENEL